MHAQRRSLRSEGGRIHQQQRQWSTYPGAVLHCCHETPIAEEEVRHLRQVGPQIRMPLSRIHVGLSLRRAIDERMLKDG